MKKVVVLGIIALFIGVGVLSTVSSANDIDVDDELMDNPVTLLTDNDVEIISFFDGSCNSVNTKGLVINEPIDIYTGDFGLDIIGLKQPVSGIFPIFFQIKPLYVSASRFIGFVYELDPERVYNVWGIAIGNIEWS